MFDALSDDAIEFRDGGFDDGFGSGDLLIVNNGDGEWSDPFQEDLPIARDEDGDGAILVALLLPGLGPDPYLGGGIHTEDPFEIA